MVLGKAVIGLMEMVNPKTLDYQIIGFAERTLKWCPFFLVL
jgi:hypothetical protein